MADDFCTVDIEGTNYDGTYYIPCDRVVDLSRKGFNSSSSSITVYRSIGSGGNTPDRIVFPSLSQPYYRSSSSSQYVYISPTSISFNGLGNFFHEQPLIEFGVLFLLSVFLIMKLFRR